MTAQASAPCCNRVSDRLVVENARREDARIFTRSLSLSFSLSLLLSLSCSLFLSLSLSSAADPQSEPFTLLPHFAFEPHELCTEVLDYLSQIGETNRCIDPAAGARSCARSNGAAALC
jgi:hypothetical protein